MNSWMERHNSNTRNRAFNQTLNGINLNLPYLPDGTEENGIGLNEWSNDTRGGISMSRTSFSQSTRFQGTSRTISDFVTDVTNTGLIPSEHHSNNARSSLQTQHSPSTSFSQRTQFRGASRTVSDFVSGVTNTGLIPSENLQNNARSSLQTQNLHHAPTTSFFPSTHFHGPSRTVSDFVSGVTNSGLIPSNGLPNHTRSSLQTQRLLHAPTVSFSQSTHSHGASRTISDFVSNVTNTSLIPSESISNNTRSSIQTQNLWRAPTASFSQSTHLHTNFHGGEMSSEAALTLEEPIGSGLNKSVISALLKQSKYESSKMKNCSDYCCICCDTYEDGEEIVKINCGHEFHYQCISKWLEINNSCPICRRIALTPF